MIALRFDLAAPIRRKAVLFLTSKTSVNIRSDFLALGFLTVTVSTCDIGLFSVNISGVDKIASSITALYCC